MSASRTTQPVPVAACMQDRPRNRVLSAAAQRHADAPSVPRRFPRRWCRTRPCRSASSVRCTWNKDSAAINHRSDQTGTCRCACALIGANAVGAAIPSEQAVRLSQYRAAHPVSTSATTSDTVGFGGGGSGRSA